MRSVCASLGQQPRRKHRAKPAGTGTGKKGDTSTLFHLALGAAHWGCLALRPRPALRPVAGRCFGERFIGQQGPRNARFWREGAMTAPLATVIFRAPAFHPQEPETNSARRRPQPLHSRRSRIRGCTGPLWQACPSAPRHRCGQSLALGIPGANDHLPFSRASLSDSAPQSRKFGAFPSVLATLRRAALPPHRPRRS
ncbi:hypothetical protein ERJ75_000378100 [Trypanosoma vivax]|nr:hypothetical protein ERJ75_000378100 [Trypanosoma vivax]